MENNKIFIVYAPEDEEHKENLERHLKGLKLEIWHSGKLLPGQDIAKVTEMKLQQANIVLLLLSSDFMASKYFDWQDRLIEMHENQSLKVVPILLRACLWQDAAIGKLTALPKDNQSVIQGDSMTDNRFRDVAIGIKSIVYGISVEIVDLPPLPQNINRPDFPFLGLRWFTRNDAHIFFGRGAEIKKLYDHIIKDKERLVLLYGQSGVGKSSFLHGGFLPRLEKTHKTLYIRRDINIGLVRQLQNCLYDLNTNTRTLLVFDQVEEIYTNPLIYNKNHKVSSEVINFFALLQDALNKHKRLQIILGFRKEYFADVDDILKAQGSDAMPFFLKPLSKTGVLEAIMGVCNTPFLKNKYNLNFPEAELELPYLITDDICRDTDSHIAPLLQLLLYNMWNKAYKRNREKPTFTTELYNEMKQPNLDKMLEAQLEKFKKDFPKTIANGLALDILYFHTSELGTAAKRGYGKLQKNYNHIDNIYNILDGLKKLFLLTGPNISRITQSLYARLAHDSLAPLVIKRFNTSDKAGQRAFRILESKRFDMDKEHKVEFSKMDMQIIQEGLQGMRQLSELEQQILADNQERLAQVEKDLEEKNRALSTSLKQIVSLQLKDVDELLFTLNYTTAHEKIIAILNSDTQYQEVLKRCIELAYWYVESQQYKLATDFLLTCLQKNALEYNKTLQMLLGVKATMDIYEKEALLRAALQTINYSLYDELNQRLSMKMINLQGGTFWMGSPADEKEAMLFSGRFVKERDSDEGMQKIKVEDFAIADTPITVFQYAIYCSITQKRNVIEFISRNQGTTHPLVLTNWYEAIEYCNWLSLQHNLLPVYEIDKDNKDPLNASSFDLLKWTVTVIPNTNGYRLPTESEWEYAARSAKSIEKNSYLSSHYVYAGSNDIDEVAWYTKNSKNHTWPVKQKKSNVAGLYDMSGNVMEWCYDWYIEDRSAKSQTDTMSADELELRSLRGGSYYHPFKALRIAFRTGLHAHCRDVLIGFRVIRNII